MKEGWIGVDFDGTLSYYDRWRGAGHVGAPIGPMVERVREWLAKGYEVRIFTARIWPFVGVLQPTDAMPVPDGRRAQDSFDAACAIAEFCIAQFGRVLPITNVKDYDMIELWDDRAVHVVQNTGRQLGESRL